MPLVGKLRIEDVSLAVTRDVRIHTLTDDVHIISKLVEQERLF